MVVRIAIVEDEEQSAKLIEGFIAKYGAETDDVFEVVWYPDGDAIAADYRPVYDIIFMDIKMKILNGMEAAEYIRKFDKDVVLIFITNMSQYAIKGYKVGALDFLLKPVPFFAFSEQLKRSIEKIKRSKTKYLLLATEAGIVKIDISLILYIESFKHKMIVRTKNESHTIVSTMQELEEKLSDKGFFRSHKGYLVNMSYVCGIEDCLVRVGEHRLLLSRARKKVFMEELAAYVGGIAE